MWDYPGDFHAILPYGIKDLTPQDHRLLPDSSLHVSWNICLFKGAQCWWMNNRLNSSLVFHLGSSVLCHGVCEWRWPNVPHSKVPSFWRSPSSLLRRRDYFCTHVPTRERHHLSVSSCWEPLLIYPQAGSAFGRPSISHDRQLNTLAMTSTEGPSVH